KLIQQEIPVIKIKNFLRNMSILSDFLAFFEVWRIIIKTKPDVLHVTSSKAGGIGALAGRLSGVKNIVFTSHGLTFDEVWRPSWQRVLIYAGTWLTMRLAHQSIMISTETYERAHQMPSMAGRVKLIWNGVADIDFVDKSEARKKLASYVSNRAFWIGGIGELHPNKNWSVAIKTMASLPNHVHLLIIGEGEERQYLETLIKKLNLSNRVHLLGYIDGATYLKAYDVYLLPSLKEGLPYVLLEAGLAGLPVIASDIPGNQDIIESGQSGFLVKPTIDLLATTLQMLIRDEGMRRQLGNNLQVKVKSSFFVDQMVTDTIACYESNMLEAV
ncbi:glycosyltransferase, partial [Candidatus Kaiserbacteria bacterium]|nr:glycosyltransferase [Candidatus Kaiserbacteria bacterium]